MIKFNEATQRQVQASDPASSTWLSANAGSGKTRVLTDRVARLLLQGVSPQNILCLTFTKAAASEMQNRLFKRLGQWSMLGDAALSDALEQLGMVDHPDLATARTLFARAIETPGGLKIQTIHSFCSTILRAFPLEAGISPRFVEIDDSAQKHLLRHVGDDLADLDPDSIVSDFLRMSASSDIVDVMKEIVRQRGGFEQSKTLGDILVEYDAPSDTSEESIISGLRLDPGLIARTIKALSSGTDKEQKTARHLAACNTECPALKDLDILGDLFLYKSGEKQLTAKVGAFPNKPTREAMGGDAYALDDLMCRVEQAVALRQCLSAARDTLSLQRFAVLLLQAYDEAKQVRGMLDFDDLINRAAWLLGNSHAAQWVLYRLDGGVDHILVDEAQDTSPAQWKVVELLTQEFGSGLNDRYRSFFVVGDRKQSIYSFQGADAEEFDRMEAFFQQRLAPVGGLQKLPLDFSFRSSPAVLEVVDETVRASSTRSPEKDIQHRPFFDNMAGRVDLWPLVSKSDDAEHGDWTDPIDRVSETHPSKILAHEIAKELHRLIKVERATIPVRPDKAGKAQRRYLTEGDVLILVQRRQGAGTLFQSLIAACKAIGLRVAGADRLRVASELAVRDLRAVLAFLALPEDSLSLAAALRSPIFGWSESDLFRLAAQRSETHLWQTLRKRADEHPETFGILSDLRDSSDFLRPYDLLERILIKHDGRRRLLSRLGPEVEDGVDELLNLSLAYERTETPSLTGFLAWLQSEDVEIKRQVDTANDMIQVMTVHGAKGLERPVVILPDTMRAETTKSTPILRKGQGTAHWRPKKDRLPPALSSLADGLRLAEAAERNRLLYVAMTRAESWLIVCGAEGRYKAEGAWYEAVQSAMDELKADPFEFGVGSGLRYATGEWTDGEITNDEKGASVKPLSLDLPDLPGGDSMRSDHILSPSDLGGAKALPVEGLEAAQDTDASLRKGRNLHLLLETLPEFPQSRWPEISGSLLRRDQVSSDPGYEVELVDAAGQLLLHPDLRFIFAKGTLAEVAFHAALPELGGRQVQGVIDRLVIDSDRVLAVDFKTNLVIPESPEQVPEGILRQMGAYLSALRQIYPNRQSDVGILWTETRRLMPLPHDIVIEALKRSTIS